ncbi:MAG TPA: maleylpyruvate isomerase family mycothiol-dependent enzyme, partial [Acidimicrobiia bacterium]
VDVIDWYEAGLDAMLAALTDSDPETACWAFGPSQCVAAWETRMVIETGVHRWDAYQAFGEEDRLTDRVAVAGLEEFADMWLPRLPDLSGLEVVAEDLGRSWVYGPAPRATVSGTASDIYLRLMSRPSPVLLPDDWVAAVDDLAPPRKG